MNPKYDYETIKDASVTLGPTPGVRYRIRDIASDNMLASCADVANAKLIVHALNSLGENYMDYMRRTVMSGG
jgi:hypothetical protein